MKLILALLLLTLFILWPFGAKGKRSGRAWRQGLSAYLLWTLVILWTVQLGWYLWSRWVK